MRVFGWKTLMRNESKGTSCTEVGNRQRWHYRPIITCERFE
jgi:hypothetical protein